MRAAYVALVGFLLFVYLEPGLVFPVLVSMRAALLVGAFALVAAVSGGARLPRAPQNKALALLLACGVASTAASIDPVASQETLPFLVKAVMLYAIVVMVLDTCTRALGFVNVHLMLGTIVAVTSILATRAGIEGLKGGDLYRIVNYFGGLGDDPNEFGALMVALLPLPLVLFTVERSHVRKVLLALAALAFLLCIIRTRSRGAFVAVLVMAPFLGWHIRRSPKATIAVIAMVLFAYFHTHAGYWERLASLTNDDELRTEYSASSRMLQQGYAADLMRLRPLAGVGPGNFVRGKVELLGLDPAEKATRSVAHNAFLGLGAEIGVPGLLAFLSGIGISLTSLRRAERHFASRADGARLAAVARGLRIGLLGFGTAIFFLSEQFNVILYMWIGMAVVLHRLAEADLVDPVATALLASEPATEGANG